MAYVYMLFFSTKFKSGSISQVKSTEGLDNYFKTFPMKSLGSETLADFITRFHTNTHFLLTCCTWQPL